MLRDTVALVLHHKQPRQLSSDEIKKVNTFIDQYHRVLKVEEAGPSSSHSDKETAKRFTQAVQAMGPVENSPVRSDSHLQHSKELEALSFSTVKKATLKNQEDKPKD